jgi:hypothetical protein
MLGTHQSWGGECVLSDDVYEGQTDSDAGDVLPKDQYEFAGPSPISEPPLEDEVLPEDPDSADDPNAIYFTRRLSGFTYFSKSFPDYFGLSEEPRRFIYKVFDPDSETWFERSADEWVLHRSPTGRSQVKLLLAGDNDRRIEKLWIQKLDRGNVRTVVSFEGDQVSKLVEVLRVAPVIPVSDQGTVRIDNDLLREVLQDPTVLASAYRRDKERFRDVIKSDSEAQDVIAVAHRRELHRFERLLGDEEYFQQELANSPGPGAERVWQDFFQENPWIFGFTLDIRFLTAWDDTKLEQVVAGASVAGAGKRTDALLCTAEVASSFVLVEIKTPSKSLLGPEYRSGCWAPSDELAGGVAQLQGTVDRACREIGERLYRREDDGSEVADQFAFMIRPRSFLVIGKLDELFGTTGGINVDKFRSFELFRRNMIEPDIVTFDALLARARCIVEGSS